MTMKVLARCAALALLTGLAGCVQTTDPMETQDGSFVITSTADAYGSQATAMQGAQGDAQKFCAQQGKRAIAVAGSREDGSPGSFLFANRAGMTGGAFTLRYNAALHFRCVDR